VVNLKKIDPQLLESYHSQTGETLKSLVDGPPRLLVFLRHFG
jgi:hypothetical protein